MGAVCCCFRLEDCEEFLHPNSSFCRECICLRCLVQQFLSMYTAIFHRGIRAVPSSIQGVTALGSPGLVSSSLDTTVPDTYRAPPRPLPYDVDPRCSCLLRGPVSRREKASTHMHEESEPLRISGVGRESLGTGDKWNGSDLEGGSKDRRSENQPAKVFKGEIYILNSSEDEDVCPTCLEDYTTENPKIMTKCSHHFHLGCIYEWMERSESCPVCGKVMMFDESV